MSLYQLIALSVFLLFIAAVWFSLIWGWKNALLMAALLGGTIALIVVGAWVIVQVVP